VVRSKRAAVADGVAHDAVEARLAEVGLEIANWTKIESHVSRSRELGNREAHDDVGDDDDAEERLGASMSKAEPTKSDAEEREEACAAVGPDIDRAVRHAASTAAR